MKIRLMTILTFILIIGALSSRTMENYSSKQLKNSKKKILKDPSNVDSSKLRMRRQSEDNWLEKDFKDHNILSNVQALIVRAENVPECGKPAEKVTNSRYFMCSGAIISEHHVITSASCVHLSYVYEHHIKADMAVLVGITSATNFVIKITRHEVHPDYNFDLDSKDHPIHNIALLYLACPIPCMTFYPKMPTSPYENVAHTCCSERCEIMTIVQRSNNRHIARVLKAKHVPSPTHEQSNDGNTPYGKLAAWKYQNVSMVKSNGMMKNLILPKRVARSSRLAAPPVYYAKESVGTFANDLKDQKLVTSRRKLTETEEPRDKIKNPEIPNDKIVGDAPRTNLSNDDDKMLTSNFTRMIVDAVFRRINDTIANIDPDDKSLKIVNGIKKNATLDEIVDVIVKPIASAVLVQLNDTFKEDREDQQLLDRYQECPPLGSPVMSGETLVALVAYTCDDIQNWVEWKYVNIATNIEWINDQLNISNRQREEQLFSNNYEQKDDNNVNVNANNCYTKNDSYYCDTKILSNNNLKRAV